MNPKSERFGALLVTAAACEVRLHGSGAGKLSLAVEIGSKLQADFGPELGSFSCVGPQYRACGGRPVKACLRLKTFARHWAPAFVVPYQVDRLLPVIINNAKHGKIGADPCSNPDSGRTFSHQIETILITCIKTIADLAQS